MKDNLILKFFAEMGLPPNVKSKAQVYALFRKGFLGNQPLMWDSLSAVKKSKYDGLLSVRSRTGMPREYVEYDLSFDEMDEHVRFLHKKGYYDLVFNEALPDDRIVIQGELWDGPWGLNFHCSREKCPMNEALSRKSAMNLTGLQSKMALENFVPTLERGYVFQLLNFFQDHVIEFSVWDVPVGNLREKAIVWEIRRGEANYLARLPYVGDFENTE